MNFCRFLLLLAAAITLHGCGASDDPSRPNTFTPLTSLEISAPLARIAQGTSTPLSALGNFSGLFTRDISTEVLWDALDPQVAVVSNSPPTQGRVTGLAPGTAVIRAELDGVAATFQIEVSDAQATTLAIAPEAPSLAQGLGLQLSATGTFSDASNQDLTFDAAWSSAAPTIAEVGDSPAEKGRLRGLSPGSTDITASFGGLSSAVSATVTAAALQSLDIRPRDATLANLTLFPYRATGRFSNGSESDLTAEVTWAGANSALARVDNGAGRQGEVRALLPGTTRISASLGGISASTGLGIIGAAPASLSLTPANPALALNTSLAFSARATLTNGAVRDVGELVTWTSSNTAVAEISNLSGRQGRLQARNPGTTQVTANLDELSISTTVIVTNPTLQGLSITPAQPTALPVNTSLTVTATGVFLDAPSQDLSRDVTWSSANPTIADVDTSDPRATRIKAKATGNTTLTASFGGREATVLVSVINPDLVSLTIGPAAATRDLGTTLAFTAGGVFAGEATSRVLTEDVSWSSSNDEIVSISNNAGKRGLATLLSRGTVTIRATFGTTERTTTLTVN
ncbi:Ig-like domain-containing protein [Geoalkalibacter sp.]|uniref:Ig-like domain-containing protein n=1 Tax=Geoalkalibacter sp. TaxID=3041440 RepID=UPI00272ED478|nr:Ig-like domain-containing protein [Geoalkalibacter sp.]